MSGRFKFEISANGFPLKNFFSEKEELGIDRCKRYMTDFQKKVANVPMKVVVSAKEKQKEYWRYHGQPYHYSKTMIRKPLVKKSKNPPPEESTAE